jgi:hypothetical protein
MRRVPVLIICGLALICTSAYGAGGPVSPVQGGAGVSAPGGRDNFVAIGAPGGTVVLRIARADASVQRTRLLRGSFGVPGAAYDGTNTGLSADGSTLVLASFPGRGESRLIVLRAQTLRLLGKPISLRGSFTVDAISPDGRWLYLIHYTGANALEYEVRAYDLERRRLLARPIVDRREPDEKMQGTPVTRVQSPDGRWAYTLYAGEEPFIHALDTAHRTAACIDLPKSLGDDIGAMRLRLDGGKLAVVNAGARVALANTQTFAVSTPRASAHRPPARTPAPSRDDSGAELPWAFAAVPLAALCALALRRAHRAPGRAATGATREPE